MYREQFVRENPEKAAEQDKVGNRGIIRVIAITTLGIATIIGAKKYCTDEDFRTKVNEIAYKLSYEAMRKLG